MCLKTSQKPGCHFLSCLLLVAKHLLLSIPPCDHHSSLSGSAPHGRLCSGSLLQIHHESLGFWVCSLPNYSPYCSRVIFLKCKIITHHFCLTPFIGSSSLSRLSFLTSKTLNHLVQVQLCPALCPHHWRSQQPKPEKSSKFIPSPYFLFSLWMRKLQWGIEEGTKSIEQD